MVSSTLFLDVLRVINEAEEVIMKTLQRNRAKVRYWLARRFMVSNRDNSLSMYHLPGGVPKTVGQLRDNFSIRGRDNTSGYGIRATYIHKYAPGY